MKLTVLTHDDKDHQPSKCGYGGEWRRSAGWTNEKVLQKVQENSLNILDTVQQCKL